MISGQNLNRKDMRQPLHGRFVNRPYDIPINCIGIRWPSPQGEGEDSPTVWGKCHGVTKEDGPVGHGVVDEVE